MNSLTHSLTPTFWSLVANAASSSFAATILTALMLLVGSGLRRIAACLFKGHFSDSLLPLKCLA